MRKISQRVKNVLFLEPEICALKSDGKCAGRITWEHAIQFRGRQLDEPFAIIKICARHHSVDEYQDCGLLDKEKNLWVALNRATDNELISISKAIDYKKEKQKLNEKYGAPKCL